MDNTLKMPTIEDTLALKIITDLEQIVNSRLIANTFDIIPEVTNDTNISPVNFENDSIALDAWAIKYVVPYAHRKLIENNVKSRSGCRPVELKILRPCILALNLLHPEMPTAWNTRKELIVSKKLCMSGDFQLTKLALSRAPNCNEPLAHRRWLLKNYFMAGEAGLHSLEINLIHQAADQHHCNFHAWSHWSWCLKHFAPLECLNIRPTGSGNEDTLMSYYDFHDLFETTPFVFYYEKLKTNTAFFVKHVSDYSSVCQRIHLIEYMFKIVDHGITKNECNLDDEIVKYVEAVNDVDLDTTDFENEEENSVYVLYKCLEQPILEILRNSDDVSVKKYISQNKINIKLGYLLKELKRTENFLKLFQCIEAILYYRRFLIFTLNNLLSVQGPSLKSVVDKLYDGVIVFEKTFVELLAKDSHYSRKRVVDNYDSWLKKIIFKDLCNSSK